MRTTHLDPHSRSLKHPQSICKHDHIVPRVHWSFPTNPHSIHSKALFPLARPSAHPQHSPDLLLRSGTAVPPQSSCPAAHCRPAALQGDGQSKSLLTAPHTCLQHGLCKGSQFPYLSALWPVLPSHSSGLQGHISTGHGSDLKHTLVRHLSPFDTREMPISGCKVPSLPSNFRCQFGTKWKSPTGSEQTIFRCSTQWNARRSLDKSGLHFVIDPTVRQL